MGAGSSPAERTIFNWRCMMFVQPKFAQDPRTMTFEPKAVAKAEQRAEAYRARNPLPLDGFQRNPDGQSSVGGHFARTGHWGDL